jgi:hypothetical protein
MKPLDTYLLSIIIQNTFILCINTLSHESFNPSRNMTIQYEGNLNLHMRRIKTRKKQNEKQAFMSMSVFFFKIVRGPSPFGYHDQVLDEVTKSDQLNQCACRNVVYLTRLDVRSACQH